MNAPCMGCPDRVLGCHDRCDRYKAFHAEREEKLRELAEKNAGSWWHAGIEKNVREKQRRKKNGR